MSAFVMELEEHLDSLAASCKKESMRVRDLKTRVMLETAAEVLSGLVRAFHESQYLDEMEEHPDEHFFSPKSKEPWD